MSIAVPAPLLRLVIRLVRRGVFAAGASWPQVRRRLTPGEPVLRAPHGVTVEHGDLDGVRTEILRPAGGASDSALLYLHGGGFACGAPRGFRALAGRLAQVMGATAYVIDYRLAPEHPYPAGIDDCERAYRALLAAGFAADRIAVAGDSAGGGHALELAMRMRDEQLPAPAAIGLISPFVDWTAESSAFRADGRREPILSAGLIARCGDAYLADRSEQERREVSPLYRDLAGLPSIVLDAGADDILVGDARRLAEYAAAAGVPVRYREHPGLWHVFHLTPHLLAQAERAVVGFGGALAERLRPSLRET